MEHCQGEVNDFKKYMTSPLQRNQIVKTLLLYIFAVNSAAGLFAPLLAVFASELLDGSLRVAGFAVAIYSIVKSTVQVPCAKFIDKRKGEHDDYLVLLTGAVLGTLSIFSLAYITQAKSLYALQIVSGVADALLMAAFYGIFSRHIDKNCAGYEWSMFSVFGLTVSTAIGGAIGGMLTEAYGFHTTFLLAGFINLIAIAFLLLLYPRLFRKESAS